MKFYEKGLRWSCTRCSYCCRHESGYVFLSEADAKNLARQLEMRVEHFIETYCRFVAWNGAVELLSLKETSNNDCFFWKDGCTVYNARPGQCRTYPFWKEFLADEETWRAATADCPGVGQGPLHDCAFIEKCAALEDDEPPLSRPIIRR